ncbi:MAG: hypothetical protein H6581_14700 [Bacteroidia bacterium]|nr:hypothetical protein [Bacteroidia bacterium]
MEEKLNKTLSNLYNEVENQDNFLVDLRSGKGLNLEKYNNFLNLVRSLEVEYKGKTQVPKKLCLALFGVPDSMYGDSTFYNGQELEKILEKKMEIEDAILSIFL